uniref:Rab-GAP TBC domain-containing protein n=1 Tax=Rhizophora mucronata TaxID=61149 RepID=A0A2P2KVB4_RHIMU
MFNPGDNNPQGIHLPGGGAGTFRLWWSMAPPPSRVTLAVTALAGIAVFAAIFYTTSRGHIKSPWSVKKRKPALSPEQWRSCFMPDGKLLDGGVKFLKKVRSRGVDPSIRVEVWPFLLGVYDLNSSKEEREVIRTQKRKEYKELRQWCQWLLNSGNESSKPNENGSTIGYGNSGSLVQDAGSSSHEDVSSTGKSLSSEERKPDVGYSDDPSSEILDSHDSSMQGTSTDVSAANAESDEKEARESLSSEEKGPNIHDPDNHFSEMLENNRISEHGENDEPSATNVESSESNSSEDPVVIQSSSSQGKKKNDPDVSFNVNISLSRIEFDSNLRTSENFDTWQRIIRVDAVRANGEWISYSPSQAAVSDSRAHHFAEAVGLKDYDHLEPCRIFHAARLVAILEAYALYDPEIGYCQGMSDLLSPVIAVIEEDHEAFWCFVGFMRKARHNFRLDEVGIQRQLNIVSKIIKCKDSRLYRHLEMLQAEDCFFVYRMVVVLFRRELSFEQTLCLWEVMWADQAAIRAGFWKSAWKRIRQQAPPTGDLLLYAIAASVLQRRKLIIEKYNSMDEILRECNSMAGQLDVWKLLDDAHDLVVTLYDKIETSF